jgi:toxin-antitoxin system PIN domain toxin
VIVPDINVLVYAHRAESPRHAGYRAWLTGAAQGAEPLAIPGHVAAGFLRIVTHPGVLKPPTDVASATEFLDALSAFPAVTTPALAASHVAVFLDLCRRLGIKGRTVSDAYLAAIVIDLDAELVTADRGFARFPDLRWRHPLDAR